MIPFLFGWSTNYWDSSIIVGIYQLPLICLLIFALLILKPYYLVPIDFKLVYRFGKLNLPLLMPFALGFCLSESNSNFILVSICLVHNFSSFLFLWYVGVFWKQYSTRNLKIFEIFFLLMNKLNSFKLFGLPTLFFHVICVFRLQHILCYFSSFLFNLTLNNYFFIFFLLIWKLYTLFLDY